ncbi:hypothetical protein [Paraburkholderia strydomiana]|uniref:hypothetical protein n=1 Tax=Paraburkholderia strydomiana TaxID=1245417 RepID=UPI001BE97206|nr:hypothetical protein [Paraburkholderia strydomiana]MBT2789174.1 hypothetical protein [Paraburkholderia strydomiana]
MYPTDGTETRGAWLFRHLLTLYGSRFLAMWRGVNTEDLKHAWSQRLHGVSPEALRAGLEALEGVAHPPTLPEFLALCREARVQRFAGTAPRLPGGIERASAQTVAANVARMRETLAPLKRSTPSPRWAFELLARRRARNGAALTAYTRRVIVDAVTSSAGRAYFANASAADREHWREAFGAVLHECGDALPSRVPGEDDEPLETESEVQS